MLRTPNVGLFGAQIGRMNESDVERSPSSTEAAPGEGNNPEANPSEAISDVREAMAELKAQLDATVNFVKHAMAMSLRSGETEMSGMFIRAQQFIDRKVAEAEDQVTRMFADAQLASDDIIADARRRAKELADRTNRFLVLSPDALDQLEESIDSFVRANKEVTRGVPSHAE